MADGIVLWYTPINESNFNFTTYQRSFGGPHPNFTGLMIAVDIYKQPDVYTYNFTYNHIRRVLRRSHTESAIIVAYNNASETRMYNWDTEGYEVMLGRCVVEDQKRVMSAHDSEKLVVIYKNATLYVYHTSKYGILQPCVSYNMTLPKGYNFGVSASSGEVPGYFSINSLKLYEIL